MARFLPLNFTRVECHCRGPYGSLFEWVWTAEALSALSSEKDAVDGVSEGSVFPVCV